MPCVWTNVCSSVCVSDDALPVLTGGKRVRQAGPHPKGSDSERTTMDIIDTEPGMTRDKALVESVDATTVTAFPP